MDWLANMQAWQALPPEVRRAQAWAQIPASVAASMALEGEPIPLDWIKALHDQSDALEPPHHDRACACPLRNHLTSHDGHAARSLMGPADYEVEVGLPAAQQMVVIGHQDERMKLE